MLSLAASQEGGGRVVCPHAQLSSTPELVSPGTAEPRARVTAWRLYDRHRALTVLHTRASLTHGILTNSHKMSTVLILQISRLESWASLVAQLGKNPPAIQDTLVQFLGQEDLLEKG